MTKGERIKSLRCAANMTQEELAAKLKTSKQTIYKYEKDIVTNIPSDNLEVLAATLGTTPEYILGWEQEQKNNDIQADIVVRMRTDQQFFCVVEKLYRAEAADLKVIENMLDALLK